MRPCFIFSTVGLEERNHLFRVGTEIELSDEVPDEFIDEGSEDLGIFLILELEERNRVGACLVTHIQKTSRNKYQKHKEQFLPNLQPQLLNRISSWVQREFDFGVLVETSKT